MPLSVSARYSRCCHHCTAKHHGERLETSMERKTYDGVCFASTSCIGACLGTGSWGACRFAEFALLEQPSSESLGPDRPAGPTQVDIVVQVSPIAYVACSACSCLQCLQEGLALFQAQTHACAGVHVHCSPSCRSTGSQPTACTYCYAAPAAVACRAMRSLMTRSHWQDQGR